MDKKPREPKLSGVSMEESVLACEINIAERRAKSHCSIYDSNNMYWKKVDELLEMQQCLQKNISVSNEKLPSSISCDTKKVNNSC